MADPEIAAEPTEATNIKMDIEAVPDYTESRDQPPAYSEPETPPPSYNDIFGTLRHMKDESSGNVDLGNKVFKYIFCSTVCVFLWIGILAAVPIAMIVIGARGLQSCPIQRYIPIYLVVAGSFGLLKSFANLGEWIYNAKRKNDEEGKRPINPFDGCVNLFLTCWFFAGNYWVYSVHTVYQSIDALQPNYCDQTVYLFAFWTITLTYIIPAFFCVFCIFGICIGMCCASACKKQAPPMKWNPNAEQALEN